MVIHNLLTLYLASPKGLAKYNFSLKSGNLNKSYYTK